MRLSEHFTLAEFTASQVATRRGIDNSLPPERVESAAATAQMLERIREFLSRRAGHEVPVIITSGYRCKELNRAIGSRDTSDHTRAQAADIRAPAFGSATAVCRALAPHLDALGIGQLINEFPGPGGWVHVSTRKPEKLVNRVITINAAGTSPGIKEA